MERRIQPYTIHKRPTVHRNRSIYYAQFRDPETGHRQSAVSTGCTRRDDAVRWCKRYLASARDQVENITFAAYATGFWEPDATYAPHLRLAGRCQLERNFRPTKATNTDNPFV